MRDGKYSQIAIVALAISAGFVFEAEAQTGAAKPKYRYARIHQVGAGEDAGLRTPRAQGDEREDRLLEMYRVRYPNGDDREYDFVTAMENPYGGANRKKVLGDMLDASRKRVKGELWQLAGQTDPK